MTFGAWFWARCLERKRRAAKMRANMFEAEATRFRRSFDPYLMTDDEIRRLAGIESAKNGDQPVPTQGARELDDREEIESLRKHGYRLGSSKPDHVGLYFPDDTGGGLYISLSKRMRRLYGKRIETQTRTVPTEDQPKTPLRRGSLNVHRWKDEP